MVIKSNIDALTTDEALVALLELVKRKQISQVDLGEAVAYLLKRREWTTFHIARLQSGLEMPDVMPAAIELVIKDRELLRCIKSLKELHP